jgi:hypothetical protein
MNRLCCSAVVFLLTSLSVAALAQKPPTRADAETLLRQWKQTNLIEDGAFAPFLPLKTKALPLFAPYLTDKELGTYAEFALQKIDPVAATPYLLRVLPQKDVSTQANTIRAANRAMMEYSWHERAGSPQPKPGEPAPRFPRNTQAYPYGREMHDVAVAILKEDSRSGPERLSLLTVGLTGHRRDFALLRKYAANESSEFLDRENRYAALAALARLGDKTALDFIAVELQKSVKTKPAERYSKDGVHFVEPAAGAIVVTPDEAQRLRSVMEMAAFTMNRRFIPLIIPHLDDPNSQSYGDYSDPHVKMEACFALGKIALGTENLLPVSYWKDWWAKQNQKP